VIPQCSAQNYQNSSRRLLSLLKNGNNKLKIKVAHDVFQQNMCESKFMDLRKQGFIMSECD
jgi:hypothetical protein